MAAIPQARRSDSGKESARDAAAGSPASPARAATRGRAPP
jgi:hypothetical protein